ncbi:MAG: hypothetical protein R3F43_31460 [bacterium]
MTIRLAIGGAGPAGRACRLAQICRRAVAREPADRFESVEALRLEVGLPAASPRDGLADEPWIGWPG